MKRLGIAVCVLAAVAVFGLAATGMGQTVEKTIWSGLPQVQPGCYWGKGAGVRFSVAEYPQLVVPTWQISPGTYAARGMVQLPPAL